MRKSPEDSASRKQGLGSRGRRSRAGKSASSDWKTTLLRLEALEERTLLSASPTLGATENTAGVNSPSVQAMSPNTSFYSPGWLGAGYGVDKSSGASGNIMFGATPGTGAGQTIVIVDAYNDPDIANDLAAFDTHYVLATANLTVRNQSGTVINPALPQSMSNPIPGVDPIGPGPSAADWEAEESLDVEWAHAIAPGANIVLIEANSSGNSDLFGAASIAANYGSIVSMSWGQPEFTIYGGETSFDSDFVQTGVTYLAATGDAGNPGNYPAFSPNVVAVGGTDLYVSSSGGAAPYSYSSETYWGSGGGAGGDGISDNIEAEPSYQDADQSSGYRAIPDISANAGVGVWSYDSYNNTNGGGNWFGVGGTSLAAPIMAGMIAIADQGRVAEGATALSGPSQTLPALYTAPTSDFHKITSSTYDDVTGLGSPQANLLIPDLVAYGEATQLAVTTQPPSPVAPNATFGLQVAAEDSAGVVDTSYTGTVTISLANNPGGSTLGGTLTATAFDGVATFNNLTLNQVGTGYKLQATATGLTTTTTSPFNVVAPPVVTPSGSTGQTFTVGGAAVAVDSGVSVSSSDPDMSGATVTDNLYISGDTFNYSPIDGITISSNSSGVLTLTGSQPAASYTAALQSVTFSTTSTNTSNRSISIVVTDGTLTSNTAAESVKVGFAPPVVSASGTTNTYTLGGSAVAIDSGIGVTSHDPNLTGAKLTINNYMSGDSLNFTAIDGVTISSNSGGVLQLTGNEPASSFAAALQSVTFSTTSGNATARSISVVADDSGDIGNVPSNTAAETVDIDISAPVVTPSGTTGTFTLGGSAKTIDSGINVTSHDGTITGATVTINNDMSGDSLNYTAIDGVTISSNAGGVLTLTGNQPASSYQAALASVTFSTTNASTTARSISVVAYDTNDTGNVASNTAAETVDVGTPIPVVSPSGTTNTFTLGGSAVTIDSAVGVSSYDNNMTGATVTINNDMSGDALNYTAIDGVTIASNSAGVLTLTGNAPASSYAAALATVTFSTTSTNATSRSVSIVATDGSQSSNPAAESVNVAITPPVVSPSGTTSTFTLGGSAVTIDSTIGVTSTDTNITGATVTINNDMSGDALNYTAIDGVTIASNSGGVLTLTGNQPASSYAAALQSVTFSTTASSGTARSISVVAHDSNDTGNVASNSGAETVNINIPSPVVTANQSAKAATVGQTVAVDSAVTVTSPDANVTGATVTISNFVTGDTLGYTAIDGVTIASNTGGVLTLTGNQPASSYQAALQSVTFSNTTSTNATTRNISIAVADSNDTGNVSGSASTTITLTAPLTITAAYLSGTAWTSAASHPGGATEEFEAYLSTHSLGSATLGYNLQDYGTFSGTQTTPLPWGNINQITVTFSGAVSASSIGLGSLELVGGTGSGSVAAPSVSSFTSDGSNTYTWTLSGSLGNNKYVFAIATTGSSFGTPGSTQVTDNNGAGISGAFATGNSLPSGNGFSGSTFDYFFNVLPGDVNHTSTSTSATDITLAKQGNNLHETSGSYNPYIDFLGAGATSATDVTFAEAHNSLHNNTLTAPTAPSASQVGTTGSSGFTALALGVLDTRTSSSSTTTSTVVSNVTPLATASSTSTTLASTSSTPGTSSGGSSLTTTNSSHGRHQFAANDVAVGAFDLADLWV